MAKKILFVVFLVTTIFILNSNSFSQTLYFCEGVDKKGNPINESQTFYIPSGGGYLYFLVHVPYDISCETVYYDIYEVDNYYNETYNTTITQEDLNPSWNWFWKKVTFYTPGYYHIYVRDCYGYNITSSYLDIYYQ